MKKPYKRKTKKFSIHGLVIKASLSDDKSAYIVTYSAHKKLIKFLKSENCTFFAMSADRWCRYSIGEIRTTYSVILPNLVDRRRDGPAWGPTYFLKRAKGGN